MFGFVQTVCVVAIALGAGLMSFGSRLEPQFNVEDPASYMQVIVNSHEGREQHYMASVTSGVGTGFLVLGALGLVVPWINRLAFSATGELSTAASRILVSAAVWASVTIVCTFGLFRLNWNGSTAMAVLVALVGIIFGAATAATAYAFGWTPWKTTPSAG